MTFLILLSCQSLCHLNTREIFIEKITFSHAGVYTELALPPSTMLVKLNSHYVLVYCWGRGVGEGGVKF